MKALELLVFKNIVVLLLLVSKGNPATEYLEGTQKYHQLCKMNILSAEDRSNWKQKKEKAFDDSTDTKLKEIAKNWSNYKTFAICMDYKYQGVSQCKRSRCFFGLQIQVLQKRAWVVDHSLCQAGN